MAGQEARINDALKQLGEEYRLGMVQLAEYRSRRKLLIESWGERDVTTSPRKNKTSTATGVPPQRSPSVPASSPEEKSAVPLVIAAIAVLALAAGGWYLFRNKPAPAPAAPAVAPLSPAAAAISAAADGFVSKNAWDAAAIGAFLDQWKALNAADRARVADEPAMRALRSRLDQNIQAEMQLVTPESSPEERAQLTLLQDFARSLNGESQ